MKFSAFCRATCACAALLLAGCASSVDETALPTTSSVASTRTKPSTPDLEPLPSTDGPDEAAMLRSTPNYSITTSELTSEVHLGVTSGAGIDPLLSPSTSALPGELPQHQDVNIDINLGPAPIDLSVEPGGLNPH